MFSKSQYQTASDIVQLANAIIWLRNNQLQQFHLTSSQSDALLYILRQPEDQEITAGSLIQDLHLSQSTVAGITKRLEAKGLIRRTVSPDDNRKSIIAVTEQGRCLMEALRSNAVRTEALLLNGMPESERQELRRLLHLASDNLNAFRRNGGAVRHE